MKVRTLTTAPIAALLLFAAASCSTETEFVNAPSISLESSVVTVGESGGAGSLSYTVVNPVSGGTMAAASSDSWISDIYCGNGVVTFEAGENPSGDLRTATITLTYTYTSSGSRSTCSCAATVAQATSGQPGISVQPTAVAAKVEGGSYSFSYTIVNPVADGTVSAETSEEWITGISTATSGKVSFNVAENEGGLRQGTIDVTYTYSGGSVSEPVTVVQDHEGSGANGSNPVGTYICYGDAYSGYSSWELKIYEYDSSASYLSGTYNYSGDFDYFIDGLVPDFEGGYDYYGDHRCSAAAYMDEDGNLHIPAQVLKTTNNGYYIGYVTCTQYSGGSYYYSFEDDLVFTSTDAGEWESDYGVFLAGFTSLTISSSTFAGYFDVVTPTLTLEKTSDELSVKQNSVCEKAGKGLENLEIHKDIVAE